MMTPRDRILNAAAGKPVDSMPIWIMRQAGRYLPEYRELKQQYDFVTLVQTPELAVEVTMQPLFRYPLDAAILFSDILVIPEALGQPYHFREQGGIGMDYTLNSAAQVEALNPADAIPEKLNYVSETLKLLREELDEQALLGFGGSPWTLAVYMVEGGSSKHFSAIKELAFNNAPLFEALMNKLTDALITYFKMQIESGADAIQIFDSWASLCAYSDYEYLSLQWIRKIIKALPVDFPIILYAKGMGHLANTLADTGASVLGLDWTVSLNATRKGLAGRVATQGNLDPILLNTSPDIVRKAATDLLASMDNHTGHIFNLGHGITPSAKIENVTALVDIVHDYKLTD